jgi:hypothetical protein
MDNMDNMDNMDTDELRYASAIWNTDPQDTDVVHIPAYRERAGPTALLRPRDNL